MMTVKHIDEEEDMFIGPTTMPSVSDIRINAKIKLLINDCRRNLCNDMMPSISLPVLTVYA